MGKEKSKKNKVKYNTAEQEEILKFLIMVVVVIAAVGGIYLATRIFVTKDFFKTEEQPGEEAVEQVDIDYSMAIMGQILNRPYDEYYVAIFDAEEGEYMYDMASLLFKYSKKENHLHMYTVDLANVLNNGFYDPANVNVNAKTLAELKVGDITLLKIKKGKINKYIVDLTKMKEELGVE